VSCFAFAYLITFSGFDAGWDEPQLTADSSQLLSSYNTITTAYNADGQITSIGDNFSHYAYTYDGQGNVASVDNAGTPGVPDVLLSSSYDASGNRSSLSATIAGTADFLNSYGYNTLSQLDLIDQQGQTGGNAVAPKSIYFGLDAIGDITEIDRANSVSAGPNQSGPAYSVLSYNDQGQLTGIKHEYMGASLDDLTYTFDPLGRVSTFSSIDGTATYGYDPTSQLISATYTTASGGTQPPNLSLAFDPNGNRTSANGTGTTVSPNNEVTNDGTFTYQFDPEGNRTVRTRISTSYATDYKTTYAWDYRNRLTDVETFDNSGVLTSHVHYVYDVWDHLIERDVDPNGSGTYTQTVHYVWDASAPPTLGDAGQPPSAPGNIVLAFNASQQLTTRYLNGPNTSAYDQFFTALAEEDVGNVNSPGTVYYYLLDDEGSLTDTVGANGALENHVTYAAYGQDFNETNSSIGHLTGFGGGLYDPATQLINFLKRWYDPAATVWISADPTGFRAGDMNESRYVGNDPTNLQDPTGLGGNKTVDTSVKGFKIFLEWFPEHATGEIKIMRGAKELAILKYVVNKQTGVGACHVVSTHAGKVLPGIIQSKLRKLIPDIVRAIDLVVARTGGKWASSGLAAKAGGRLGLGAAASAFFGAILNVLLDANTCDAAEIPRPERIALTLADIGLSEQDLKALFGEPDYTIIGGGPNEGPTEIPRGEVVE